MCLVISGSVANAYVAERIKNINGEVVGVSAVERYEMINTSGIVMAASVQLVYVAKNEQNNTSGIFVKENVFIAVHIEVLISPNNMSGMVASVLDVVRFEMRSTCWMVASALFVER